jgi:K+-transporting ATPase KdpF subunit
MNALLLVIAHGTSGMAFPLGYVIGAIIALLVMGYLVYSLVAPEKF